MKFEVSRSIGNINGGLTGMLILAAQGYDFMVINNKYSVLISKDHCSMKSFSGKSIPKTIINKTAEYLKYKKFHTEQRDCLYIYNDEAQDDQ